MVNPVKQWVILNFECLNRSLRSWCLIFLFMPFVQVWANNKTEALIIEKTNEWNIANSTKNIGKLWDLFDENPVFYGKRLPVYDCLSKKENFFERGFFSQVIVSEITVQKLGKELYKSSFKKQVNVNGKSKVYPSYLVFRKIKGKFKIIEEGDEITNANINYEPSYEKKKSEETSGWFLPVMVSVSSVGLFAWVAMFFRKRKGMIGKSSDAYSVPANSRLVSDSVHKGRLFEEFVVDRFDERYYKIIHWQGDKSYNGRHAESNRNPDLVMNLRTQSVNANFAVECKFRSNRLFNQPIQFCEERQLNNYKNYGHAQNIDVFLVLGLGGTANAPRDLFVLPIMTFNSNVIDPDQLRRYYKNPKTKFFYDVASKVLS